MTPEERAAARARQRLIAEHQAKYMLEPRQVDLDVRAALDALDAKDKRIERLRKALKRLRDFGTDKTVSGAWLYGFCDAALEERDSE